MQIFIINLALLNTIKFVRRTITVLRFNIQKFSYKHKLDASRIVLTITGYRILVGNFIILVMS